MWGWSLEVSSMFFMSFSSQAENYRACRTQPDDYSAQFSFLWKCSHLSFYTSTYCRAFFAQDLVAFGFEETSNNLLVVKFVYECVKTALNVSTSVVYLELRCFGEHHWPERASVPFYGARSALSFPLRLLLLPLSSILGEYAWECTSPVFSVVVQGFQNACFWVQRSITPGISDWGNFRVDKNENTEWRNKKSRRLSLERWQKGAPSKETKSVGMITWLSMTNPTIFSLGGVIQREHRGNPMKSPLLASLMIQLVPPTGSSSHLFTLFVYRSSFFLLHALDTSRGEISCSVHLCAFVFSSFPFFHCIPQIITVSLSFSLLGCWSEDPLFSSCSVDLFLAVSCSAFCDPVFVAVYTINCLYSSILPIVLIPSIDRKWWIFHWCVPSLLSRPEVSASDLVRLQNSREQTL